MAQKHSVGLVLLTNLSADHGNPDWRVILQVRGEYNPEKAGPESWPGACQVTCHGSVEEGEDEMKALFREIEEEIGYDAMGTIFEKFPLRQVNVEVRTDKVVSTYAAVIPKELIASFKLGPASGGLRLLPIGDIEKIYNLRSYTKEKGVTARGVTAMFPDEIAAIKNAVKALNLP